MNCVTNNQPLTMDFEKRAPKPKKSFNCKAVAKILKKREEKKEREQQKEAKSRMAAENQKLEQMYSLSDRKDKTRQKKQKALVEKRVQAQAAKQLKAEMRRMEEDHN